MLVDLKIKDKQIIIVGGNGEVELKTKKLIDAKANITIISNQFTNELMKLESENIIRTIKKDFLDSIEIIRNIMPYAVFISTENEDIDREIAISARNLGALVNVIDRPHLNDFDMPAIAKIEDVRVAISTGGSSPAMASIIRQKIEKMNCTGQCKCITHQDLLQIKLQSQIRKLTRELIEGFDSRKEVLYTIIHNEKIKFLLENNQMDKAIEYAERIIRDAANRKNV